MLIDKSTIKNNVFKNRSIIELKKLPVHGSLIGLN